MSGERRKREARVEEVLSRGDLAAGETRKELWKKNVSFVRSYDRHCNRLFWPLIALWLVPAVAKWSGWRFLSCFGRLSRVDFPIVVIVIGSLLFITAIALEVKVSSMRQKRGGCHDLHETVVIVREGPYRVIRHPGYLAELIYFPLLPIVLSRWVPFTILAVAYIVVWTGAIAYLLKAEDHFNLRKWGDEYRRYVEEVPAVNFAKGLKRLREEGKPPTPTGAECD